MKTNSWLRVGLLTLSLCLALPAVAQRKKGSKQASARKATPRKPKAGNFLVLGTAPEEANGKQVYLYGEGQSPLDSTVVKEGKFHFERPVDKALIVARILIPQSYYLLIIPEAGTINAPMDKEAATGTPLNDLYAKLKAEDEALVAPYRDKLKALRTDASLSDEAKEEAYDKIVSELNGIQRPRLLARLTEHPSDAIGYHALQNLLALGDVEAARAEAYAAIATEEIRNSEPIAKQLSALRRQEATKPGAQFTDFTGVDDANQAVSLSDYVGKGHYVLVDFWASWCGPCRREIGHLKQVRDAYSDKGLVILGAAVWDEMEDHLKAMKDLEITWPQIVNKNEATELYGIQGIPQIILFDPEGKIVARDLRGKAIDNKLNEILSKTEGKL